MQSSSRFVYFTILQLFGNGVHLGAHITKRHSQMVRYIITLKRLTNYDIINLNYTLIYLRISFNYLHNVILKRGIVLVANNHLELDAYFRNNWIYIGQPISYSYWISGTMSNFRVVLINAMKTYYLKVKLSRRIEGLYRNGKLSYKLVNRVPVAFDFDLYLKQMVRRIRHLCCVPHAVFTPDTLYASVAVREANVLSLPLIGVVDSYSSIFSVAYPIPGNTQSFSSVMFFYKLVRLVILKGFITEHLRFYRKLTNKFTMNNGRSSKAKKKKLNFLLKKKGSSETKVIKKVSKFLNKTWLNFYNRVLRSKIIISTKQAEKIFYKTVEGSPSVLSILKNIKNKKTRQSSAAYKVKVFSPQKGNFSIFKKSARLKQKLPLRSNL